MSDRYRYVDGASGAEFHIIDLDLIPEAPGKAETVCRVSGKEKAQRVCLLLNAGNLSVPGPKPSVEGVEHKKARIPPCDNCGKPYEEHGNTACDFVWGRRGWRQRGVYDG